MRLGTLAAVLLALPLGCEVGSVEPEVDADTSSDGDAGDGDGDGGAGGDGGMLDATAGSDGSQAANEPAGVDGICGHYTQMVWAETERVGCGIGDCPGLTYGGTIVCNDSPGGNAGGQPY